MSIFWFDIGALSKTHLHGAHKSSTSQFQLALVSTSQHKFAQYSAANTRGTARLVPVSLLPPPLSILSSAFSGRSEHQAHFVTKQCFEYNLYKLQDLPIPGYISSVASLHTVQITASHLDINRCIDFNIDDILLC